MLGRISLEELSFEQHLTALATAVLGVVIYFWLSHTGEISLLRMLMSAFWTAIAFYAYAVSSNVRIDGIQSVVVTLIGMAIASIVLYITV